MEGSPCKQAAFFSITMPALVLICLTALALAGCSGPGHESPARSSSHPLARPERYHVMEAALRYELGKHSANVAERDVYSGYILDCEEFTQELVRALTNYVPPVLADALATTDDTGQELLDKSTGKHIKVWRVHIVELRRNVATACMFFGTVAVPVWAAEATHSRYGGKVDTGRLSPKSRA